MGGLGSGRWGKHRAKYSVEQSLELTVTTLREGLDYVADNCGGWRGSVQWSTAGRLVSSIGYEIWAYAVPYAAPVVRLVYTTTRYDGTKIESGYPVEVMRTVPNYGGWRWWWLCPLSTNGTPCKRKVTRLYKPPSEILFGCRHCHDLTYRSCQESHKYDALWADMATRL